MQLHARAFGYERNGYPKVVNDHIDLGDAHTEAVNPASLEFGIKEQGWKRTHNAKWKSFCLEW